MTTQKFAFYFPQFTSDPINDHHWFPGFTDWDLIKNQIIRNQDIPPYYPAKGFYDQSLQDIVDKQVTEAKDLGIQGFCCYHYWFGNKATLGQPVQNLMMASLRHNFPFFLCWANESWSKRWIGKPSEIIVRQGYDTHNQSINEHATYLLPKFCCDTYFKIDNRPVFAVYNPYNPETITYLRSLSQKLLENGVSLYLIAIESSYQDSQPENNIYDSAIRFEPRSFFSFRRSPFSGLEVKLKALISKSKLTSELLAKHVIDRPRLLNYQDYSDYLSVSLSNLSTRHSHGERVSTSIIAGWDNSPRYLNRATKFINVTQDKVKSNLERVVNWANHHGAPLILINAWNEWSEGAAIEESSTSELNIWANLLRNK